MDVIDPLVGRLRAPAREVRDQAWRELYDAHFDRVYRLGCRFGVRESDVEDITQRIFFVAHERLREVDQVRDVGAWLRGIAVRVVSDYHRFWRIRAVKRWLLEDAVEPVPARGPEDETSTRETQARVAEVLSRMSEKLRTALVLLEIEQCTPSESAEILGVPVNTVRSRGRLAREQFQCIWETRFGSGEP